MIRFFLRRPLIIIAVVVVVVVCHKAGEIEGTILAFLEHSCKSRSTQFPLQASASNVSVT